MRPFEIKKYATAASRFSTTRLALNYYSYYEIVSEATALNGRIKEFHKNFLSIMKAYLKGQEEEEALIELRKQVMEAMEDESTYVDRLQLYEYVLNRVESRFYPEKVRVSKEDLDVEVFTEKVMSYITSAKDSAVMNARVQDVLEQLPVRLTKEKFFGLVSEGLSAYIGAERKSLDDMFYALRSVSMLNPLNQDEDSLKGLRDCLEDLHRMDFNGMTKEQYDLVESDMKQYAAQLVWESDMLLYLQELINDLYVLFLTKEEALRERNERDLVFGIAEGITALFEAGGPENGTPIPDAVTADLEQLEGRQEQQYESFLRLELPPGEDCAKDQGMALKRMTSVDKLLSGSPFVSLAEIDADQDGNAVDRPWLESQIREYETQLREVFSRLSRPAMRAIMARVLSSLPVYFNTVEDIQNSVRSSLDSCLNEAERLASIYLLNQIMEWDNALV